MKENVINKNTSKACFKNAIIKKFLMRLRCISIKNLEGVVHWGAAEKPRVKFYPHAGWFVTPGILKLIPYVGAAELVLLEIIPRAHKILLMGNSFASSPG